jgi:hypothetical protein
MALVLRLRKGQDFFVADEQVVVSQLFGDARFELEVASTGKRLEITEEESTELMPDVFISSGGRAQSGLAKIAIDAPREIAILRGENYRTGGKEAKVKKVSYGSRWA